MISFNNDIAMNYDAERRAVLKKTRVYNGKRITYESYLKQYMRSMSFLYKEVNADSKRYKKVMSFIEDMAKQQWQLLPKGGTKDA